MWFIFQYLNLLKRKTERGPAPSPQTEPRLRCIAQPYPPTGLRLRPSPDARTDAAGNRQRSSVLTRDILPFLFMGQATKHELRRMDETARRTT